ncbi:MAG: flagellar hook assembly protein FlgD [Oscillospiraceae bacterium]
MAGTSGILSSSEQIQANYEKYKSKFKDATEKMVNSDTFLSLLVAEMTNQDPMEPTSNTEFVTQMAQFTSLQYSKDAATYSQSNYASSLVGKTVTASKMDGSNQVTKTGVVQSVMKNGDSYTIKIDGVSFELSNITSIAQTDSSGSNDPGTKTSLGELIAKASMMIGMSATVNPSVEGGSVLDSGLIKSIQVKDGQVRVIINDKGYALDDIVEVAYPTISGGGGSDSTGGTDKKPSTDDKTEPPSADKTADSTETTRFPTRN